MKSADILLNIFIFIGVSLLMSVVCINMVNQKGDGRNTGAGYRTKRAMKSIKSWNVANRTFGYCTLPIPILEGIAIFLEDKVLVPHKIIQSELVLIINMILFLFGIVICYSITEKRIKNL